MQANCGLNTVERKNKTMAYAKHILLACAFIVALALAGCMVGPNYRQPEPNMPPKWQEASAPSEMTQPTQLADWWMTFNDPILDQLIKEAICGNLSLKQAESRLRQARAQRRIAAAGFWPSVNASGTYQRIRGATLSGVTSGTAGAGGGAEFSLYEAGFDASWELDMFGGVRRSIEAASANVGAALEDRRDVLVSLLAEVAINYVNLRGFQRQIVISEENLKAQRETLELTKQQFEAGTTTELVVAQSQTQVAATAAQIPVLETSVRQTIHQLSVLLGKEPMALSELLSQTAPIPAGPPQIPVGLPSELLRQRADIRRAERQLAAATANIGVATADLFPKFSLTGSLGRQGMTFESLGQPANKFWSVGPSVSWPVFDAGSIRANIQVQSEIQKQTAAAYEQTVLTALQEVEDVLVAYAKEQSRRKELVIAADSSRQAYELANQQYLLGTTDFLNVLIAQRALYAAQSALVQSDAALSANMVTLYKALGGGWQSQEQ
jgi:multidrug efflux system outer membrane protein